MGKVTYALLVYADEGTYYYTPLEAKTLDEAREKALEILFERGLDKETDFKIMEISNAETHRFEGEQFSSWFKHRRQQARQESEARRERDDRDLYESLKKRFEP